ncbi:MAG: hypothetical protein IJ337_06100, partial [Clostridia bacterium]|nr:hypothetical protein [Clostridia bacterium]
AGGGDGGGDRRGLAGVAGYRSADGGAGMSSRGNKARRSRAGHKAQRYLARLFWAGSSGMVIGSPDTSTVMQRRRVKS